MKNTIILWDWDNTLADSGNLCFMATNETLVRFGLPPLTQAHKPLIQTRPALQYFGDFFPVDTVREAFRYFTERYLHHSKDIQMIPGALEVLDYTLDRGYTNILLSNKRHFLLEREVAALKMGHYFRLIQGSHPDDPSVPVKPSKAYTDAALALFPKPDHILCIGDGKSDMQMAAHYENASAILVWPTFDSSAFKGTKVDHHSQNLFNVMHLLKEREKL